MTMRSIKRGLIVAALAAMLLPMAARAQQAPPESHPAQPTAGSSGTPDSAAGHDTAAPKPPVDGAEAGQTGQSAQQAASQPGLGGQLAEASREAAGEEDNSQFKKSATVQWLARVLHIPFEAAYWVFYGIDFGIVALLVVLFVKSKLPGWFRTRNESIRRSIEEAQRTSEEARTRLSAIETRLARIDAEVAAMQHAAENEAKQEEERIRAAAAEDEHRIIASAQQEIAAASKLAQRELKAYAATLAVELAERRIKVDLSTDRALVRQFAEQFGKDGE